MTIKYTINKLCKATLVSIRTLHYYDEIDLLKPSYRTSKGHRLYSQDDMLRLQQIVTLKLTGFSLQQIRKIMQNELPLLQSLRMQVETLTEEVKRIDQVLTFTNYLIEQSETNHDINWEMVTDIIKVINSKESANQQWFEKYLNQIELHQFKKFSRTRTNKWKELFAEVKKDLNVDPESATGQKLARQFLDLANEAYGNHPELLKKLWEGYKAGVIPKDSFPYDKDVITFLSKAAKKLLK